MPVFEMPNGDVLHVNYNRDRDSLDVGTMTNAGMTVKHHYPYDHNMTLDANLQGVNEQLNDLEEYRENSRRPNIAVECDDEGKGFGAGVNASPCHCSLCRKYSFQFSSSTVNFPISQSYSTSGMLE